MTCAIYARKSTDQGGPGEARSVTRQVEHARAFAARKGWTVLEEHIYIDDGISGAEFKRRPGFLRLMNALEPRAPFDVLIVSESSRLGREMVATQGAMMALAQAGVAVWSYLEDREHRVDSALDKMLLSLRTFSDELEREKARQRTYDAMLRKARAGHVTGGRVFGYRNVDVTAGTDKDGRPIRSHVRREIHPEEAAVVRRIFRLAAEGVGVRRLCRQLNAEGAPAPRAQQGRPVAWAPSSVLAVLRRELYRGVLVWNQTQKRNAQGQTDVRDRPAEEWVRIPMPELQIVDDALWGAAHGARESKRTAYLEATGGAAHGRPGRRAGYDLESKYLLPGFLRCARCGGGVKVISRSHGRRRAFYYVCSSNYDRGRSVCPHGDHVPLPTLDGVVLGALETDYLRPEILTASVDRALDLLTTGPDAAQRAHTEARVAHLARELERLAQAIAAGGPLDALVSLLQTRTREHAEAVEALEALRTYAPPAVDRRQIRRALEAACVQLTTHLQAETREARGVLRALLLGPLVYDTESTSEGRRVWFRGKVALGRLLGEAAPLSQLLASPVWASWNQLEGFLRAVDGLRLAA